MEEKRDDKVDLNEIKNETIEDK